MYQCTRPVPDLLVWIGSGADRQLVRLIKVCHNGEWHCYLANERHPAQLPALYVVARYYERWRIEVFHKVLKSGCRVEDCLLQTAARLQNYIALMSVVAWRLHWLTYINRTAPDLPCTHILTTVEWQALYLRMHHTTQFPPTPPTVRQAVRWIAQLGGFLGRKSDGEPGVTVIWRGWQRLQDLTATWEVVVTERAKLVGNR